MSPKHVTQASGHGNVTIEGHMHCARRALTIEHRAVTNECISCPKLASLDRRVTLRFHNSKGMHETLVGVGGSMSGR